MNMVYYGLSMNTNFLGGNLYLTFFLGAAVDTPANILVFTLIDKTGRKPIIAGGFILVALMMVTNWMMDQLFGEQSGYFKGPDQMEKLPFLIYPVFSPCSC